MLHVYSINPNVTFSFKDSRNNEFLISFAQTISCTNNEYSLIRILKIPKIRRKKTISESEVLEVVQFNILEPKGTIQKRNWNEIKSKEICSWLAFFVFR